ncbi:peroxiredoxin family protein [Tautonia sociabilis]|uniref:thioredoxin-dependent peroxiredoxin n=1 Tax=Tautonia sociabilis TaxID=2080755 RepID=A0A432MH44_9BACT|nr:redoxin domain-containing protein [Tautonia sociabilis]RUL86310.1 redoxin domain-containing protein [Tautonia sociabilis]
MSTRIHVIAIGALAVAFGGGLEERAEAGRGQRVVVGVLTDEEHRVTPEMERESREKAGSPAPAFRAVDQDGEPVDSEAMVGDRPVLLVFIKDGCPCSTSAEPFYARLHDSYGDAARFFGVIDGDRSVAARWVSDHGTPYPVLADPELEIVRAFGVSNSAYVALISPGGTIEALWPGYSEGILRDISARLAGLTGRPEAEVGASEAPELPYSGCPFEFDPPEPADPPS